VEASRVVESITREMPGQDQDSALLLAAALAAALVEYGRYTDRRPGQEDGQGTQANWRMMARWEQLRR
jgi:hypothetical protein